MRRAGEAVDSQFASLEGVWENIFELLEQLISVLHETREIYAEPAGVVDKPRLVSDAFSEKYNTKRALANSQVLIELSEQLKDQTDRLEANLQERWMEVCKVRPTHSPKRTSNSGAFGHMHSLREHN